LDVLTFDPTESLQFLLERRHAGAVRQHVVEAVQDADAAHFAGVLRTRRCRPDCRAAKPRYELPSSHSITSSARASNVGGNAAAPAKPAMNVRRLMPIPIQWAASYRLKRALW
jgi:hypothetical protein